MSVENDTMVEEINSTTSEELFIDVVPREQVVLYPHDLGRCSAKDDSASHECRSRTLLMAATASTLTCTDASDSGKFKTAVVRSVCTQPNAMAQSRSEERRKGQSRLEAHSQCKLTRDI